MFYVKALPSPIRFLAPRASLWPYTTAVRSQGSVPEAQRKVEPEEEFERAKPLRTMPGPRGLPYFGNILSYRKGPHSYSKYHEILRDNYHKYGSIFKETMSGRTTVRVFDPDDVRTVYMSDGRSPKIAALMESEMAYRKWKGLGPGLDTTNGDQWYRLRTAINPQLMIPKAVTVFLAKSNKVADDFIQQIQRIRNPKTGFVQELDNELYAWVIDAAGMTCFETKIGCIEADRSSWQRRMVDTKNATMDFSTQMDFAVPLHRWGIPTRPWKKFVENEDFFIGHVKRLFDETCDKVEELRANDKLRSDQFFFATHLLSQESISYNDRLSFVISVMSDGMNAIAPALLSQLYCLAANQDKQQKLYEQISEVASNGAEPVTEDMIQQVSYLHACMKEGLRLFPPGPEISRIAQKDMVLAGYQIPEGTHLSMSNNIVLREAKYFDEPNTFLPERWLRGQSTEAIHPYLVLPFSFGPRMCIGRRLAEQELRLVLIKLMQNFRIECDSDQTIGQIYQTLLNPHPVPQLRFIPRTTAASGI